MKINQPTGKGRKLAQAAEENRRLDVAAMFQGDPRWGREKMSAEEERRIEGVLDQHGMRTITLYKDNERFDRRKLQTYRNLGYEIEELSDRYLLRISQATFLANKAEDDEVNRRNARSLSPQPWKDNLGREFEVSPDEVFSSTDLSGS